MVVLWLVGRWRRPHRIFLVFVLVKSGRTLLDGAGATERMLRVPPESEVATLDLATLVWRLHLLEVGIGRWHDRLVFIVSEYAVCLGGE